MASGSFIFYERGIMRITRTLLVLGLSLAMATPAFAQDDDVEIDYDKYSKVSEQKLMLTGQKSTTLGAKDQSSYETELGMGRFNMTLTTKDPNDASVGAWCDSAVKDTQVKRDEVDGETGDAQITLKAKIERCSQVFKFDLEVKHSCKKGKSLITKKMQWECTVDGTFTAYKYKADQSSGSLKYDTDSAFGKGGKVTKTASWTSSSTIGKTGEARAKKSALSGAASWAGRWMSRQLRDIREFQVSGPIVAVRGSTAMSCLSKDVVEQDLPFYIVFNSPEGEKQVGFAKARKRYDGCTLTPSLEAKQEAGEKVELKPMESQVIIGSPKASMTLWEMPTMHLNVGLGGGIMPSVDGESDQGNMAMGLNVLAEYNPRFMGWSEVHIYSHMSYGLAPRENLDALFFKGFGVPIDENAAETAPFARASIGILKRIYMGRLFLDVGVAGSGSYYLLEKVFDWDLAIISYGAEVQAGLGFQLSPRFLLRAQAGFHYGIASPEVTDPNGNSIDIGQDFELEGESGIMGGVHLLYTI
jgi:hypothetical protein